MAGSKRERELARAKFERQEAKRRAESQRRRRRYQVVTAVVVAVLVVAGVAVLSKTLGSGSDTAAAGATSGASTSPASSGVPTDGSDASCDFRTSDDANSKVDPPAPTAPTRPATSNATLTINGKKVQVQLLASKAPCSVLSFRSLAAQKYFDKTPCHRLTKGSLAVLQCGDPTGSGSGGPGYQFNDENLTGATYPAGTVAMANSGPNTNGSQFFIVYANSTLDPAYTPFGKVVGGLDVITAIAKKGVKGGGTDGAPAEKVTIDSVTTAG